MARYKIDCCQPNCPKRSGECHSTCKEYKKQRAELDATNAETMKKKEIDKNLNGHFFTCIDRYHKRINNRNKYGGSG